MNQLNQKPDKSPTPTKLKVRRLAVFTSLEPAIVKAA
jgi:hypothetical protein